MYVDLVICKNDKKKKISELLQKNYFIC